MSKLTAKQIEEKLDHCIGSAIFYKWSIVAPKHVLTEGAKMVADLCDAHWLMDIIASYHSKCMEDEMLRYFQVWTLTVKDGTGVVTCERDTDDIAFKQKILYTDFPLDKIKLYCSPSGDGEHMTILLPNEY